MLVEFDRGRALNRREIELCVVKTYNDQHWLMVTMRSGKTYEHAIRYTLWDDARAHLYRFMDQCLRSGL